MVSEVRIVKATQLRLAATPAGGAPYIGGGGIAPIQRSAQAWALHQALALEGRGAP
jgi:hypothetical protein